MKPDASNPCPAVDVLQTSTTCADQQGNTRRQFQPRVRNTKEAKVNPGKCVVCIPYRCDLTHLLDHNFHLTHQCDSWWLHFLVHVNSSFCAVRRLLQTRWSSSPLLLSGISHFLQVRPRSPDGGMTHLQFSCWHTHIHTHTERHAYTHTRTHTLLPSHQQSRQDCLTVQQLLLPVRSHCCALCSAPCSACTVAMNHRGGCSETRPGSTDCWEVLFF